ncbi:hypothetical protein ACI3KT_08605 [Microbacterium sp. ZW T6_19]|uniref:hypothetical protein n=1 Tax=Microbacterium sp. ZW T6_19 TaxID=3378082 RepID=UPI0038543EA4
MRKRRLRFYGSGDYATYWQVEDAAAVLSAFRGDEPADAATAIELHNAHLFLQAGFVPASISESEQTELAEKSVRARGAVARYFTQVDASNVLDRILDVPREYHSDLLTLLANNRAYERCDADAMLKALFGTGVRLGEMLANKKLVRQYDAQLRVLLLVQSKNAELLIRQLFSKDRRKSHYLPSSLTASDLRDLMARYIRSDDANSNYLRLIETAPISEKTTGVDARLKLEAKRRRDLETEAIFRENPGIKSGAEIRIADEQDEPVVSDLEGMVVRFSYSRQWLEESTDYPSILNNFQHLFEFTDESALLSLPAYHSELGVFERFMMTSGQTDYHIGAAYRVRDMTSTLQTQLMLSFLVSQGIELESVVSWFFHSYLPAEFNARGFSFRQSATGSSFLERTRHLLVEMESVARQFSLYVEDGEIDRELLAMSSDNIRYREIPSLLEHKYLYSSDAPEVQGILHALFSDQSTMNYIDDELQADDLATLLLRNVVPYSRFEEHQTSMLDQLIALEILWNDAGRVRIGDAAQFLLLRSLHMNEAANYAHLAPRGRAAADKMLDRGWLNQAASLLTTAESSYFNYQLNKAEFHDGPEIRNKYLHGSQVDADGPSAHFEAYVTTLKLMISLVIKINDDFLCARIEDGRDENRHD